MAPLAAAGTAGWVESPRSSAENERATRTSPLYDVGRYMADPRRNMVCRTAISEHAPFGDRHSGIHRPALQQEATGARTAIGATSSRHPRDLARDGWYSGWSSIRRGNGGHGARRDAEQWPSSTTKAIPGFVSYFEGGATRRWREHVQSRPEADGAGHARFCSPGRRTRAARLNGSCTAARQRRARAFVESCRHPGRGLKSAGPKPRTDRGR